MDLEVGVSPGLDYTDVLRGRTPVGRLNLDHLGQTREVVIKADPTAEEAEEVLRLAGAQVACYVVESRVGHVGGLLQERMTGEVSLSRSRTLLDFRAIPAASRVMPLPEIEQALVMLGVTVVREDIAQA